MSETANSAREMLRHTVATLAYRGGKAVRDVPPQVASSRIGEGSRTPVEILAHVGDLLDWALSIAKGAQRWRDSAPLPWEQEVARFYEGLARFDALLASAAPLAVPPAKLFQGPVADALTHVGQIAMLRRLSGAPMRGENYFVAEIVSGRVGPDQASPRREFE